MREPDRDPALDPLQALEARLDSQGRWLLAACLVAGLSGLLSCAGLGFLLLSKVIYTGPPPLTAVGAPVTAATPLPPGTKVNVFQGGQWWDADVLSANADGTVTVRYTGWDNRFDEAVTRDRVRLPPGVAPPQGK